MRTAARENAARQLRQSKTQQIKLSAREMDTMFNQITEKLSNDLNEQSEILDRLDVKSRQFDKHMCVLREANKRDMEGTDKRLAVALRSDDIMPEAAELTFGMGRPEFIKAPEMEDGIHNHSFVGLVSPHSNQLQELDGEQNFENTTSFNPPPPPPSSPPPAHILERAKQERQRESGTYKAATITEFAPDASNSEAVESSFVRSFGDSFSFEDGGLSVNIEEEGGEEDTMGSRYLTEYEVKAGKTPVGRPSPETANARQVRLSMSRRAAEESEKGQDDDEHNVSNIDDNNDSNAEHLAPSKNGVDWCEIFHPEYLRHYYMHHTGFSQWGKPSAGTVQCTDNKTGKIYYVDLVKGESSWQPPHVQ